MTQHFLSILRYTASGFLTQPHPPSFLLTSNPHTHTNFSPPPIHIIQTRPEHHLSPRPFPYRYSIHVQNSLTYGRTNEPEGRLRSPVTAAFLPRSPNLPFLRLLLLLLLQFLLLLLILFQLLFIILLHFSHIISCLHFSPK